MKSSFLRDRLVIGMILAGILFSGNVMAQDLKSAKLLTSGEQYEQAAEMFNQLIDQDPSNSKNYFFLGENYLLDYFSDTISNSIIEYTDKARDAFNDGINANPNDPLNYVGLAKVYNYLGDVQAAEEMRTKAKSYLLPYKKVNKKMSPPAADYAFALAKIAESYLYDGSVDTSKALPLIREAKFIDKTNPEIYLIAGDIYIAVNDGSKAIENYRIAEYYDPTSPAANMKIGNIYIKGRSLTSAIQYLEAAIALDPNFAPAYRELGQLYWSAQRLDQSQANYEKYLELTAGNIPAKILYVNSLFYAKDYDDVIKNVEEILQVDRSRSYLNRLLGYSYFDKQDPDYEKAYEYMEKLFQSVSEDRVLWKDHYYMARIIIKMNPDYAKKVADLNAAKQQSDANKNNAELKAKYDELQAAMDKTNKDLDRAFEEYNKVMEMRPGERALINEYATNLYIYQRYDKAAEAWASLIDEETGGTIEQYMQVARTYYAGDFLKEAETAYNKVIAKEANHLPAHVGIARTYSKMDPDFSLGLAAPKFQKVIDVAKSDSLTNAAEMVEAFKYLGYYSNVYEGNYNRAKGYYNRIINLVPDNKDNIIAGYQGLASIETNWATKEPELDNKLTYLTRAATNYNKVLEADPNNASAKASLKWVQDYQASVRKGINPNEIRGKITDSANKPIPFASIRVKDTAAENLSNNSGDFRFEIPQGSEVLIISAPGYTTKEVPITATRVYNVVLN
ncbi:MAG: carboxypeptidase-like regulatory domain-containing protein [Bacteroidales bacterium]|jgi:tetratricopeptide (TPR) repeat protein